MIIPVYQSLYFRCQNDNHPTKCIFYRLLWWLSWPGWMKLDRHIVSTSSWHDCLQWGMRSDAKTISLLLHCIFCVLFHVLFQQDVINIHQLHSQTTFIYKHTYIYSKWERHINVSLTVYLIYYYYKIINFHYTKICYERVFLRQSFSIMQL